MQKPSSPVARRPEPVEAGGRTQSQEDAPAVRVQHGAAQEPGAPLEERHAVVAPNVPQPGRGDARLPASPPTRTTDRFRVSAAGRKVERPQVPVSSVLPQTRQPKVPEPEGALSAQL